jgi:ATP-grasp domain-containing protein
MAVTVKKAFVLLEMMNAMLLVATEAKSRGYHVIALNHDPLKDSGPFKVPTGLVDELIAVPSWSDRDALRRLVREIAGRYQVGGTFAMFEGALAAEAALRELAGLPTTGVKNTLRVLDKGQVRRKLYGEGLSALASASLAEALEWESWQFRGPAVLKPANGTGSALCFTVSSMRELRTAAAKVAAADVINPLMKEYILAHGGFVLEEKASGELMSVESVVCRGAYHLIGLMGRYVLAADPVVEQGLFFPYHHPRLPEIAATAQALHRSLEIHHGATHLEVMVASDGSVELIDFNARFAGFASIVAFGEVFTMPFETVLADVACGIEPDLSFLHRGTRFSAEMVVLPPPGTGELREIVFPPGAIAARAMKNIGQRLTGRADQLDAVGMFIITGDTASQAHAKALAARRATLVNGEPLGGNPNNVIEFSEFIGKDLARPSWNPGAVTDRAKGVQQ